MAQVNSKRKGKAGELEFAALLRDNGYDARRGQQFAGGGDTPDVVSRALDWLHIEVKRRQRLNLNDACKQAERDCDGKPWLIAHRGNNSPWLITIPTGLFFQFLRGMVPPEFNNNAKPKSEERNM
jgi:Holliday junction resolvase